MAGLKGREMDYPNRKRLVLAFAAVAVCVGWLAVDMSAQIEAPTEGKIVPKAPRVTLLDPQSFKPAHQSVAIEARNRTAPVARD